MIDTVAIKDRILDLALRGGLVEQDISDGSIQTFVSHISQELNGKPFLPEYGKVEVPFEIPANWIWCRLSDIGSTNIGLTYHPEDIAEDGTIVVRSNNIVKGKMDYTDLVKVKCQIRENQYLNNNDIVICVRNGSKALVGKCAVFEGRSKEVAFGAFMAVFRTQFYKYVYYYFQTSIFRRYFSNDDTKQINQVTQNILKNALIPLPPVEEQARITARIERIISVLNSLDDFGARYQENTAVLKKKLVGAGIRGELTTQLHEDGLVDTFFEQIQQEKNRLIKEKVIKKDKTLPPITEKDIPFKIPSNWKWVYMGDLFRHNTGKALNASDTQGILYEYITTSNLYWDHFELENLKKMYFSDDEIEKCTITKGDLLVCEGGDIGRSAIWTYDYDMRIQNHIHKLRGYLPGINAKYYYYVLWAYKQNDMISGRGIGLQGFSSKRLHSLIVPLPPLAEQQRIVEILDGFIQYCGC